MQTRVGVTRSVNAHQLDKSRVEGKWRGSRHRLISDWLEITAERWMPREIKLKFDAVIRVSN